MFLYQFLYPDLRGRSGLDKGVHIMFNSFIHVFLFVSIALGFGMIQGKGAQPISCSSKELNALSVKTDPH